MGVIELDGIFKAKNKTAAQWSAANPVLLAGEIGIESDTRKFKFGDGAPQMPILQGFPCFRISFFRCCSPPFHPLFFGTLLFSVPKNFCINFRAYIAA